MTELITVRGILGTDPSPRTLPDGTPVCSFRLASTPRRFDPQKGAWEDAGPTNWYTVTSFRKLSQNVLTSLHTGDPAIVHGRLRLREWQAQSGEQRVTVEVEAVSIGPDLAAGTANYQRSGARRAAEGQTEAAEALTGEPEQDSPLTSDWAPAHDPETGELEESGFEGTERELVGAAG